MSHESMKYIVWFFFLIFRISNWIRIFSKQIFNLNKKKLTSDSCSKWCKIPFVKRFNRYFKTSFLTSHRAKKNFLFQFEPLLCPEFRSKFISIPNICQIFRKYIWMMQILPIYHRILCWTVWISQSILFQFQAIFMHYVPPQTQ